MSRDEACFLLFVRSVSREKLSGERRERADFLFVRSMNGESGIRIYVLRFRPISPLASVVLFYFIFFYFVFGRI